MQNTLSDADIDSIARRVVQLMGERLALSAVPPAHPSPSPEMGPPMLPLRLAYSVKELCDELGLSRVTIWRLEARGLIRSVPNLRTKLYSRVEVERFLAGKMGRK